MKGGMIIVNNALRMPIKAKPYKHQQDAFDFACRLFGLIDGKQRSSGF